jgi:flagellar hook-basal body complex protein FliE
MSDINNIALNSLDATKLTGNDSLGQSKESGNANFPKILENSINQITEMNKNADEAIEKLVSGEVQDVHQVMIAMEKANLTFMTMMQVRNKLLDAYKEVMNMHF